ncbi:hypothetical protein AVEN_263520-1 [Araneus ventricosus]|uniref:Uncharacterized protein n=1 Tax=Araneus ventricosus TaxID=182803 RepID=A0A4Y2DGL1_ARAVE|nr:hypothetical protein AVEN_229397-1 [Araneus ventricosus]GBM15168.1 hypothetical protein AVEN_263520-1 [Araneus ventricosus]
MLDMATSHYTITMEEMTGSKNMGWMYSQIYNSTKIQKRNILEEYAHMVLDSATGGALRRKQYSLGSFLKERDCFPYQNILFLSAALDCWLEIGSSENNMNTLPIKAILKKSTNLVDGSLVNGSYLVDGSLVDGSYLVDGSLVDGSERIMRKVLLDIVFILTKLPFKNRLTL